MARESKVTAAILSGLVLYNTNLLTNTVAKEENISRPAIS
jgi:hypothetical protein